MRKISKLLSVTAFIVVCVLLVSVPVLAGGSFKDEIDKQTGAFAGEAGANIETGVDARAVANQAVGYLIGLTGTLFLGYTIFAGYLIMTAHGDSERVEKGKKILRYSMIGIAIGLSAYSILRLISSFQDITHERDDFDIRYESDSEEYNLCADGRGDAQSCGRNVF